MHLEGKHFSVKENQEEFFFVLFCFWSRNKLHSEEEMEAETMKVRSSVHSQGYNNTRAYLVSLQLFI